MGQQKTLKILQKTVEILAMWLDPTNYIEFIKDASRQAQEHEPDVTNPPFTLKTVVIWAAPGEEKERIEVHK